MPFARNWSRACTPIWAARAIFSARTPKNCHLIKLKQPILSNTDLEKLREVSHGDLRAVTLPMLFKVAEGEAGLEKAVDALCDAAAKAVREGASILVLSDRGVDADHVPDPQPAGDRRGASSPHPRGNAHAMRPGDRNRRSARIASFLPAHRLRRRGGQSLSGVRNPGRPAQGRPACRRIYRWNRPRRTSSRPPTRRSSKSPARWASARCRAIAARRFSRRSA